MSLTAAAAGTELELLRALRDHLAKALDEGMSDRDRPPHIKQLREIRAEIAALESATEEVDPLADLVPEG